MRSSDRSKVNLEARAPLMSKVDVSKIELSGIPGVRQQDGSFLVNKKVTDFFAELISKEVFSDVYKSCSYQFDSIKVWLYDTSYPADLREKSFPELTERSLKLSSPIEKSALEAIYVLDTGLHSNEYNTWEQACHELYTPLFKRFVPPPDPPDILKDFLEIRFGAELSSKLNLYLDMRNHLFFDALIIQMKQMQ